MGEPVEQVDRALVPPEVVDRAGDLAVLDQVDAVAGQAGEQQALRVDLADVPETGEQQAALGAGDQLVDAAGAALDLEHQVVDVRGDRLAGDPRGVPGLDQRRQPSVGDPVVATEREPVVEDRLLVGGRSSP